MIGRFVAPAGAPIRGRDLLAWFGRWTRLTETEEEVRRLICSHLDSRYCALTSTGRAGLSLLLAAMKSLASRERDEVVVPSYTCYSVAASTVRAGLRPRVVDIEAASLDFDLEKLGNADFRRVLAIVVTNLYGLPGQLPRIAQIARDNRVFLVDDAAQSLGATVGGRASGSWGDAGLLSFDKGKPLSAIDGGAVVANSDAVARALEVRMQNLRRPATATAIEQWLKVLAYVTFLRPSLYWIPNAIPGLRLGQTEYRDDFPVERQAPLVTALAATMWARLDAFTAARVANAERYLSEVSRVPATTAVRPVDGAEPTYLRFPVLMDDETLRSDVLHEMQCAGIGATVSYPGSIADIPEVQSHLAAPPDAEVGRAVARRIVTLPTHPYVSTGDIERAITVLSSATRRRFAAVGASIVGPRGQ